jgi:hypothetical protein
MRRHEAGPPRTSSSMKIGRLALKAGVVISQEGFDNDPF